MANLTQPLAQAQAGEITIGLLRERFEEETVKLNEAREASGHQEKGWMACLDLLDGDNAKDKMNDFAVRTKALAEAAAFIRTDAELRRIEFDQLPQPRREAEHVEKSFAPQNQFVPPPGYQLTAMNPGMAHYKAMMDTPEAQRFANMTPMERKPLIRAGLLLAQTKSDDYIPVLKASHYAEASTGLLPTDRIGMPYPSWTRELDYFMFSTEPGSIIRYMESGSDTLTAVGAGNAGDAQVRDRAGSNLGTINEINDSGTVEELSKRSFGVMTKMAIEDLRDNGRVSERVNRRLDIQMRRRMVEQIFNGTNAGNQWRGIMPVLASAAADITALNNTHNAVAVVAAEEREPVAFFRYLMAQLAIRGCFPTVAFVNIETWNEIKKSQTVLRNQGPDYDVLAPFGRVANHIPMCITDKLPDNQALLIDTSQTADVVLGTEILTGISEDFAFDENAVAIRRTVYGNIVLDMPLAAIKITGTDMFQAATN